MTSLPTSNTVAAQLFYDGAEQFFCAADSCAQSVTDTNPSTWECQNLKCTCIPNSTFCGAVPAKNLTLAINGLVGTLTISCFANSSCSFGQTILNKLFGSTGLTLSPCSVGECVRQSVIDGTSNATTSSPGKQSSDLDTGVIAGLAVVGGLIFIALLFFFLGWLSQRKARKDFSGSPAGRGGYSLEWKDITYVIPSGSTSLRKFWGAPKGGHIAADDKVILDNISGRVDPGQMMAILGPSGTYLRLRLPARQPMNTVTQVPGKRRSSKSSPRNPRVGPSLVASPTPVPTLRRGSALFLSRTYFRLP